MSVCLITKEKLPMLGELLGRGSFGSVYLVAYTAPGEQEAKEAACKVLENLDSETTKEVLHEIQFMMRFQHARLTPLLAVCLDPGCFALVMERYHCSLHDLLHTANEAGDNWLYHMSWDDRVVVLIHIAEALDYLHANGGVHRDVKPANVLIKFVGGKPTAAVADFGLSRCLTAAGHGATVNHSYGSPNYMAPELHGSQPCGPASDVYAFGLIMFETGQRQLPWFNQEFSPSAVINGARPDFEHPQTFPMPDYFNALMQRCWHDDPAQRPSMSEVLHSLRENRRVLPPGVEEEDDDSSAATQSDAASSSSSSVDQHADNPAIYWDMAYRESHPPANVDTAATLARSELRPTDEPLRISSEASSFSSSLAAVATPADEERRYPGLSRSNWQRTLTCSQCGILFGLARQHHCRSCGSSVCKNCCQWVFLVATIAEQMRVCPPCCRQLEDDYDTLAMSLASPRVRRIERPAAEPEAGTGYMFSYRYHDCAAVQQSPVPLRLAIQYCLGKYRVVTRLPATGGLVLPIADCQDQFSAEQFVRLLTIKFERLTHSSASSPCSHAHGLLCCTLAPDNVPDRCLLNKKQ